MSLSPHFICILVLAHSFLTVQVRCSSTGSLGSADDTSAASSSNSSACCHIAGTPKLEDDASQPLLQRKMAFLIGAQKSGRAQASCRTTVRARWDKWNICSLWPES